MQTATIDEFTKALEDATTEPQNAPESVTAETKPLADDYAQRKARAILYASKANGAGKGSRNADGYGLAARLREKFDLNDIDLLDVIKIWNDKNTPPLDDSELSDVVKNADKYAKRPAGSGYEPIKSKTSKKRKSTAPGRKIKRRCFTDIKPQKIEYLIPEILPLGVYVCAVSQEGVGKSTLSGHWAATISRGIAQISQGDVVIFSPEESPECAIDHSESL